MLSGVNEMSQAMESKVVSAKITLPVGMVPVDWKKQTDRNRGVGEGKVKGIIGRGADLMERRQG